MKKGPTVDAGVREAAERLVVALAADSVFVAWVAQQEVARRVSEGTLIPVERLTVAPGLELVPAGRVKELEGSLAAFIAAAEDPSNGDISVAVQRATELLGRPTEPKSDVELPPTDGEAAKSDDAPVEEVQTEAKPKSRTPAIDDKGPCETCGAELAPQEALVSFTRFRRKLCRSCHAAHGSK